MSEKFEHLKEVKGHSSNNNNSSSSSSSGYKKKLALE
jgi:hypothetical protein